MKLSSLLMQCCAWALLSITNVNAATITGGTGTGTIADPFILGSGTISVSTSFTPGALSDWNDRWWFKFPTAGEYTLHLLDQTSTAPDTLFGGPEYTSANRNGGVLHTDSTGQLFDVTYGLIDDLDASGNSTGVYDFHTDTDAKDPLKLSNLTNSDPYVFVIQGSATGPGAYTMTFTATPTAVPLPGVAWLMLSGIMGVLGVAKSSKNKSASPV